MTRREIQRREVYQKCEGHCGYCGCPIELKDMQVDHITPQVHYKWYNKEGVNEGDNLLPTCSVCNHYKRAHALEGWRHFMKTLHQRLAKLPKKTQVTRTQNRKDYLFRVAEKYNITITTPFDGVFYFEKLNGR